jgi:hypothetical protein
VGQEEDDLKDIQEDLSVSVVCVGSNAYLLCLVDECAYDRPCLLPEALDYLFQQRDAVLVYTGIGHLFHYCHLNILQN